MLRSREVQNKTDSYSELVRESLYIEYRSYLTCLLVELANYLLNIYIFNIKLINVDTHIIVFTELQTLLISPIGILVLCY